MASGQSRTPATLKKYQDDLRSGWMNALSNALRDDRRITEAELSEQTSEFLNLIQDAASEDGIADVEAEAWRPVREFPEVSPLARRAGVYFRPDCVLHFLVQKAAVRTPAQGTREESSVTRRFEIWASTELLDRLGMYTVRTFQKAREQVISRQQEELLELSTPVVKLWRAFWPCR